MNDLVFNQLALPFLVRFFFIFGLLSLAVGLGLVFKPEPTRRLFDTMNRWVSTRRGLKWLEVPHSEEGVLHRYQRPLGIIAIPLLAYSTYVLLTLGDMKGFVDALRLGNPGTGALVLILMETIRWSLVVFGLGAIVVCGMLIFSPDALKKLEMPANHWFSTRSVLAGGDSMRMDVDNWVMGRSRLVGGLIVAGALVVVGSFGVMLFR